MVRQGRILIVDDRQEWCEELVAILQSYGFQVDASFTAPSALERLQTAFYHILVLDIRLVHGDTSNAEGIDLLDELVKRGLGEAIKVIMLSAYGSREQMRTLFREYAIADFLFKDQFNPQVLLKSVRQVFSRVVHINLALKIHWQQIGGPEQAVVGLEVDGTHVVPDTSLQHRMAEELEDLLCRLFPKASSVLVQPLTSGHSGTSILRVKPFYTTRGGGHEVIVKFGDLRKIKQEYHNFTEYVQPFIGGGRNTITLDIRYTIRIGGIIYSLVGTSNDQMIGFGDFYRRANLAQIKGALDQLFHDTCRDWYANRSPLNALDLAADYQRLLEYRPEVLEQVMSELLTSVQFQAIEGKERLSFKRLRVKRTFTNPLRAVAGVSIVRSTYLCITHGDFNSHNLLVDSTEHMWMIDFQETGLSHILRDVAILESAVRFQLLAAEQATLRERLQMEKALCSIERFSEVEKLATIFTTKNLALAKTYATVVHLRTWARKLMELNPDDDISEYYVALLYSALNTLCFSSLQQVQHEHALLSASLLADRLRLDS